MGEPTVPKRETLSIVIPALNEEAAIGGTIARCLEAREQVMREGGVGAVEILVVSDGSSDRTEEIARGFPEVTVLAFEHNRGYGAAILCGFAHAQGDLLAFLDADGTCDPRVFADLCRALHEGRADVALGSRLGPGSRMPPLRAAGNLLFAGLLGLLSKRTVGDTASGMRVLRRDALRDLLPLPSGLHFTPAMSARILLEGRLALVEVPMPYAERVGRSKLSVLRDGWRFLRSIVQAAMSFRPARPLLLGAALLALPALAIGLGPSLLWLRERHLEEWMIYRILMASLLATLVAMLVSAAVVAERIAGLAHKRPLASSGATALAARLFTTRARRAAGVVLVALAIAVTAPGIVEYATTRQVHMHWSRAVLGSLLVVLTATLAITAFLLNMLELIHAQRGPIPEGPPPDRVRPARAG